MHPGSAGLRRQSKNWILSSNGEVFFLLTNPLMGDTYCIPERQKSVM